MGGNLRHGVNLIIVKVSRYTDATNKNNSQTNWNYIN